MLSQQASCRRTFCEQITNPAIEQDVPKCVSSGTDARSHGSSALMSVNKVNVARRNTAPAALQPHLAQQMQNVPAGSHRRACFMLAWADGPFLTSKEMSKSHLCSNGLSEEEHYFCIRKGAGAFCGCKKEGNSGVALAVLGTGRDSGSCLALVQS